MSFVLESIVDSLSCSDRSVLVRYRAPLHGVRSGLPWLASACNRHPLSTFALQMNGLAGRSVLSSSAVEAEEKQVSIHAPVLHG